MPATRSANIATKSALVNASVPVQAIVRCANTFAMVHTASKSARYQSTTTITENADRVMRIALAVAQDLKTCLGRVVAIRARKPS